MGKNLTCARVGDAVSEMRGESPGGEDTFSRVSERSLELSLEKGAYRARLARNQQDIDRARRLRSTCFGTSGIDGDAFDASAIHIMVEAPESDALLCCFRLTLFSDGGELAQSYSAQFYDLAGLQGYTRPLAEMGRFCLAPTERDVDVLRLAWAAATLVVDLEGVELLFGCSSFSGTEVDPYREAFALLNYRHLGPDRWRPHRKAPRSYAFSEMFCVGADAGKPDLKMAMAQMPPLLRSYLSMGGWVSDHVVADPELNTLHVFTALEVGAMSAGRKRALRASALL